ncbi:hypothetical protein Nham_4286 (plasmid) [Nitrobacter hamburgensis X14]|uniref:Uncharacterized protein n=1 Tax=Nitrobacter hamburgensis (strain DSM 10229 / NCIMB 13809 / X14) TaxID=323097 RepID=Q1QFV7_NITHX|nr:hypothetical protein [Nitrobacter hamburgensis]ABE64890.1 hypothetical protein Nham_4286 [Nitrobacter hamburgensis X14]
MLETRRHLAGLDRGDVFVGQIDSRNNPTIAAGRLAPLGRTRLVTRRRLRVGLLRVATHDAFFPFALDHSGTAPSPRGLY